MVQETQCFMSAHGVKRNHVSLLAILVPIHWWRIYTWVLLRRILIIQCLKDSIPVQPFKYSLFSSWVTVPKYRALVFHNSKFFQITIHLNVISGILIFQRLFHKNCNFLAWLEKTVRAFLDSHHTLTWPKKRRNGFIYLYLSGPQPFNIILQISPMRGKSYTLNHSHEKESVIPSRAWQTPVSVLF